MNNASRKDIQSFHQWLKTLPWAETHFLYQTYMRDDQREQKLKDLFTRFASLSPEQRFPKQSPTNTGNNQPSQAGGTPTPQPPPITPPQNS